MSKIQDLRTKQALMAQLQSEIQALESSEEVKKEEKFLSDIEKLLGSHNKEWKDLIALAPKTPAAKIKLHIDGQDYEVASRGKFNSEVQAIFDKSTLERPQFIEKFKVE